MDNTTEKYSNNGWQNIGICSIFAEENIQYSKIPLYMHLVRRSFGYCKKVTNRTSQLEMSKKLKIDKKTLASHMKYLIDNKFVTVIHSNHNPKGGGSESYAYAPKYPTGYGKIYFEDDMKKSSSHGSKKQEPEEWSSENLTF
jgi:hypothetical protein